MALPSLAGDDGFGLGDGYARNTVVMDGAAATSVRQKRLALREQNTKLVQELVWLTGQTHAQVNSRLNKPRRAAQDRRGDGPAARAAGQARRAVARGQVTAAVAPIAREKPAFSTTSHHAERFETP